jgi:hypothetical protein
LQLAGDGVLPLLRPAEGQLEQRRNPAETGGRSRGSALTAQSIKKRATPQTAPPVNVPPPTTGGRSDTVGVGRSFFVYPGGRNVQRPRHECRCPGLSPSPGSGDGQPRRWGSLLNVSTAPSPASTPATGGVKHRARKPDASAELQRPGVGPRGGVPPPHFGRPP